MAKQHKGNTRYRIKKREHYANDFFAREQRLNILINKFIKECRHLNPYSVSQYNQMDKERLEIKRLFGLQQGEVWKQSYRRKRFFNKQLTKFKYHYVGWKRRTYYIYLHVRFSVPMHLIKPLSYLRKKYDIYSVRYML